MSRESSVKRFFSFIGEVRQELSKIAWPSRNEVVLTTIVVFVLAILASLFFSVVDTAVYKVVHSVIGK